MKTTIKPKDKLDAMSTLLTLKGGAAIKEVPADWQDVINLVGAKLVTTDKNVISELCDAPYKIGDCILDGWQGVYWICKQSQLLSDVPFNKFKFNGPAVVVGSGPSLDIYLDQLKAWKGKGLIVCAHSTINTLLKNGIVPDICVPIERVNVSINTQTDNKLFIKQIPTLGCYYGGLPVVPDEYKRYDKRMLVCSNDPIFRWAGCNYAQAFLGSFSGSAAIAVATKISTGPIYLVGHDIAGNHYKDYENIDDTLNGAFEISCVDGKNRPGNRLKQRLQSNVGEMLKGRIAYQCAPEGAIIGNTTYSVLPVPAIDSVSLECTGTTDESIAPRFNKLKRGMSDALVQSVDKCLSIKKTHDMCCANLFDKDYFILGTYLFRSLFAQMSMETRFGMKHADVLDWCKEAYRNAIEGIIGGADEFKYS